MGVYKHVSSTEKLNVLIKLLSVLASSLLKSTLLVKHVVGSSLFGSTGRHGGREFSSVVRFYPDVKVIATWHSKTASTRIC